MLGETSGRLPAPGLQRQGAPAFRNAQPLGGRSSHGDRLASAHAKRARAAYWSTSLMP